MGSRRACEALIEAGRVSVDGRPVSDLGARVDPRRQAIAVDGRPVRPQPFEYLLLNKPRGILCTSRDPGGRRTFLDLLPPLPVRVVSAGRLDADSEGLLLVTNDGDLVQALIHPRHEVEKVYRVDLDRPLGPGDVRRFLEGIRIEGRLHRAARVRPVSRGRSAAPRRANAGACYDIALRQGLNRQIRRMAGAVGRRVVRLRRIRMGPLALGRLPPGGWRRLRPEEIRRLKAPTDAPGPERREWWARQGSNL